MRKNYKIPVLVPAENRHQFKFRLVGSRNNSGRNQNTAGIPAGVFISAKNRPPAAGASSRGNNNEAKK
jgi:hypothetical protein